MKQVLQRLLRRDDGSEKYQGMITIYMIVLFLTFWGISFYVLLNSFA
ncbi:MAG: hypothetical protein JWR72_1286 [Flavisolibacter sp.]|jgi:hypothetical protein|nr:hypothetical protein [Flavisolibacter sp.]